MAKRPMDDDDDDRQDDKADKAAIEAVRNRADSARQDDELNRPDKDEPVEVDVDKAEDELEGLSDKQKESRSERRRNRYRELQEERSSAVKRAEEAERREREAREMLLQVSRQSMPQAAPRPEEPDPLDKELDQTFAEQRLLYQQHNSRTTAPSQEEFEAFDRKARELQKKILVLGGRIALRETGVKAQNPQEVRDQVVREQMMQHHGDVLGQQNTQMYCDGVWRQLRAKGKPDDWSTLEEAAEMTRKAFGMPSRSRRPQPSESYKAKLSGSSRGSGATSQDSGPRVVTLTKEHKAMANAMYKHIPSESERYKRWAAGPGKRLLDKTG